MKPALQVIHERSPDLSYADYRYCFKTPPSTLLFTVAAQSCVVPTLNIRQNQLSMSSTYIPPPTTENKGLDALCTLHIALLRRCVDYHSI